jgi:large conductance mechanosensitive channel
MTTMAKIKEMAQKIPGRGVMAEFKEFINEYKVLPLAIAFIIGVAATALVKSLVDNIIMPIVTPFIPGGAWQTATVSLGPIVLSWGAFLAAIINFIVIAFVVFMIAKYAFKEEKVTKK